MASTDIIALGALLVSTLALIVSWLAFRLHRNSLSLYEGSDLVGPVLYLSNNSQHAVTVSNFGFVGPDGHASSLLGEDDFRVRIDPRDTAFIRLNDEMAATIRSVKGNYQRHCLFVVLSTGHAFYNTSLYTRLWWRLRGLFDGSYKLRHRRSKL